MFSFLLVSAALAADDDADFPKVRLGGQVFPNFGIDLTEQEDNEDHDNPSRFDIGRAYLFGTADITKHLGARVTLDGGWGESAGLNVFVKHAWMEGRGFLPGVKARFGVVDTGWVTYSEVFFGHRYLFRQFGDERGLGSTADLGANIQGEHLGGLVSWHAGLYNGEGYKSPPSADDGGKTFQARVAVDPLAKSDDLKLPIGAFVSKGFEEKDNVSQLWYSFGAGFKYKKQAVVWAEYDGATWDDGDDSVSASGLSIEAAAGMPKYAMGIVRFDTYDPNTDGDSDKDAGSSIRVGVEHDFVEKVSLALMYERSWGEADDDNDIPATQGLYLRGQAGF